MRRMGVLFDYFSAATDDSAATAIDMVGGPGQPKSTNVSPKRGLLWRRPAEQSAAPSATFDTVSTKGIDPVVQMGTLEELLTGRAYDDVMTDARCGKDLAVRDEGERLVLTITDTLLSALADATEDRLLAVADPWAQTEEFFGSAKGADLLPFLRDIAALASRARDEGHRLYCWVCV